MAKKTFIMKTYVMDLQENSIEFKVHGKRKLDYTYEELKQFHSHWRFKDITELKIYLTRVNENEGNMKIKMVKKNVECTCSSVRNCPFRVIYKQGSGMSGERKVITNYYASLFVPHQHSVEWFETYKDIDMNTKKGKLQFKVKEYSKQLADFEANIPKMKISKKKISYKRKLLKTNLDAATRALEKVIAEEGYCAMSINGFSDKNTQRYLRSRAMLQGKVDLVRAWWSVKATDKEALRRLSGTHDNVVSRRIVNCKGEEVTWSFKATECLSAAGRKAIMRDYENLLTCKEAQSIGEGNDCASPAATSERVEDMDISSGSSEEVTSSDENKTTNTSSALQVTEMSDSTLPSPSSTPKRPYNTRGYRYDYSSYLKHAHFTSEATEPTTNEELNDKELNDEETLVMIPKYRGLLNALKDLYYLDYPRRAKEYKAFSFESIQYLIQHCCPKEATSAFYERMLKAYCSASKIRRFMREQNLEGIEDIELLCSINQLHKKLNSISPGSLVTFHVSGSVVNGYTCVVKAAIDNFVKTKANIIYMDGGFCRDNGMILSMSFLDQNHRIQPLGCHFSFSESAMCFERLFEQLWTSGLDVMNHLIFISDSGTALEKFISDIRPKYPSLRIEHILCVTHFLRNLKDHMAKNDNDELFEEVKLYYYKARRAPTEEIANSYLMKIEEVSSVAYRYVMNAGLTPFIYMYETPHFLADTNNVAESVNNVLNGKGLNGKSIRSSSIFGALYRFICFTLDCLIQRKDCLHFNPSFGSNGHDNYNYFCSFVMKQLVGLGYQYEVLKYRYRVNNNSVYDGEWDCLFDVDFSARKCSCKMWQQTLIPCIHAIAILHSRKEYHKVPFYVDDSYTTSKVWEIIPTIDRNYKTILQFTPNYDSPSTISSSKKLEKLVFLKGLTKKKRKRVLSRGEDVKQSKKVKYYPSQTTVIVPLRSQPTRSCRKKS